MATRIVHQVRIKNPKDDTMYVDVKVVDAIAFKGPNGQDMCFDFRHNPNPTIIDNTGDGNGVDGGAFPTRTSHMVRVTGEDDETQFFDIEVLDGLTFIGPNGKAGSLRMEQYGARVNDTDGLGIESTGNTRLVHTKKVTDKDDTETAPEDEDTNWLAALLPDGFNFQGPNGDMNAIMTQIVSEQDNTAYVTDDNGNQAPPDNTDNNHYIKWPDDDTINGPWVKRTTTQQGIHQGMLWWIVNAAGGAAKPWWIFKTRQQPLQITLHLFADPTPIGYTNFSLRKTVGPDFSHSEDWAVPPPRPHWPSPGLIPMIGYETLDAAARDTPPNGGVAVQVEKIDFLKYPAGEGYAGPPAKLAEPYTDSSGFGHYDPNVWEVTGMAAQQPFKKNADGTIFVDPDTGAKTPIMPGKALAQQVAQALQDQWVQSADMYQANVKTVEGIEFLGNPIQYMPYPNWAFKDPVLSTVPNPSSPAQRFWFIGPIPAGFWFFKGEWDSAFSVSLAYAYYINVGQLDEKVWDTDDDIPVLRPPPP